ncbi:MAG: hypothetical protein WCL00_00035 [Bacteroidota bacterium]
MGKYTRIFGIVIAAMFFFLGGYLLFNPRFSYLPKEVRVIFSVFLFLYGAFRIVRYIYQEKEDQEE